MAPLILLHSPWQGEVGQGSGGWVEICQFLWSLSEDQSGNITFNYVHCKNAPKILTTFEY